MGNFLVSTNSRRPESGTIWETGRQTREARKTLDQIVSDRQTSQQETRQAESFKEIAATILPDQWVMISPDQFRRLYLQLNPETAAEIISSFDLLELINRENWDRTYFEKDGNGLNIYLLDTENRVLRQLTISPGLLYGMGESQVEMDQSLDDMPQFGSRIYPADLFFQALDRLGDAVRKDAIPQPDQLLRFPGRITRVGISGQGLSGFTELGFEIESTTHRIVILMNGHESAVLRAAVQTGRPGAHAAPERGTVRRSNRGQNTRGRSTRGLEPQRVRRRKTWEQQGVKLCKKNY